VTASPTTHYLNADFDLSLRPRPRQREHPKLVRQVRELSVQGLLGASAADSVMIRTEVPQDFLEHLDRCGIPLPTLLSHPQIDPSTRFQPFGWSAEAAELNRLHRKPAQHPDLTIVQRVNSRSFMLALEQKLASGGPTGSVVESRAELETFLSRAAADSAWVIKAEHGNAGLANRRLRQAGLDEVDRRFVDKHLDEDDCFVVEPWLKRERDFSVVFDVPFVPRSLRVHETVCTADGALIGAWFEPSGGAAEPWFDELGRMAERVAAELDQEGYFGPVCVDAFTWHDGARTRLRSLVDLNCRRSVSAVAHRLWRRIAPERTLFYRFFNRSKIDLPLELSDALTALGEQRYDRNARRGILIGSPPRLGSAGDSWRPGRLAFLFVADERSEIFVLERWFRERFEV